jgi:FdhD protein
MTSPVSQSRDFAVRELRFSHPGDREMLRHVPIEAPVAIEVCGIGYAVMMATPSNLDDYAVGFSLSEGLVTRADEIESVEVHAMTGDERVRGGWIVRISLQPERADRVFARIRKRVSESSCGLCGVENVEQVLRPLPPVTARIASSRAAIVKALSTLKDYQPLGQATGAVHAAAFCTPGGDIVCVREDVGRHNALDKLIGALAASGIAPASGFILLSARCSYELVEKTVRAGCPMLVTISAPTSLAVERAVSARLTLVSLARADSALLVTDSMGNIASP